MGKISVFTMGHTGVVLDPHTLEPGVPPDALALAQNAVQDPKEENAGAVRKRPGLARFNNAWAGGVILGGIPMPVAGFGGAPAAGGGAFIGTGDVDDGTSVGTGDMTGAPGATFDGEAIATVPQGAALFNAGTPVFGGKRLFLVGRLGSDATVSNQGGSGWYVSSKALADVATIQITPGPPVSPYSYPAATPFLDAWGKPYCIDNIGTTGLYYAGSHGNQLNGFLPYGDGSPGSPIRRTNGATDAQVTVFPLNQSNPSDIRFSIANTDGITKTGTRSVTVVTAGTGYAVNDTLTFVGGTGSAGTLKVLIAGGLQAGTPTSPGFSITFEGSYSAVPANPITLSGGAGSGATISAIWEPIPQRQAIVDLHYATDGFIYSCIKDKYEGQDVAGSAGRVFRVEPLSGSTVEWNLGTNDNGGNGIGEAFASVPYCSAYFDGRLYVGTFPGAINETATVRATNGSFAELETAFISTQANHGFISCMTLFNGLLWLGTGVWETTPSFATLWARKPGALLQGSPAVTAWSNKLTSSGGAAANGNYFVSLAIFNSNLYASFFNPSAAAKIYKIVADTPGSITSTYTISTVGDAASNIGQYPYYLFVDDGVLYAIGVNDAGPTTSAYVTTDGTTWTSKSASLPTSGNSSRMRPIFFGVNQ